MSTKLYLRPQRTSLTLVCMTTRVITIGRNIGTVPMPRVQWRSFAGELCALVKRLGGVIFTMAYGEGLWEGQTEDTFVVVFSGADGIDADLPLLAFTYEQEAIALFVGEVVIIWAGSSAN